MKYNALRAPCDAKVTLTSDIPTFRDKKRGVVQVLVLLILKGGGL